MWSTSNRLEVVAYAGVVVFIGLISSVVSFMRSEIPSSGMSQCETCLCLLSSTLAALSVYPRVEHQCSDTPTLGGTRMLLLYEVALKLRCRCCRLIHEFHVVISKLSFDPHEGLHLGRLCSEVGLRCTLGWLYASHCETSSAWLLSFSQYLTVWTQI